MRRLIAALPVLLIPLLLASCASHKKDTSLDETLLQYEQIVRWAQWDAAVNMIHPEYQLENPITRLDLDRLRLFRVTNYVVRSAAPYDDGNGYKQTVEIRMYSTTQATERVVMDLQDWKYEADSDIWLLHSGLPDVTKRY